MDILKDWRPRQKKLNTMLKERDVCFTEVPMAEKHRDFLLQQHGFSKEYIARTRKLFEPIAGRKLSDEECADIARSYIELEVYLRKLKDKQDEE